MIEFEKNEETPRNLGKFKKHFLFEYLQYNTKYNTKIITKSK